MQEIRCSAVEGAALYPFKGFIKENQHSLPIQAGTVCTVSLLVAICDSLFVVFSSSGQVEIFYDS